MSATRVYLGRLPPMVREDDIFDHFKSFKVKDVSLRGNYGFVEFENGMDAEDAIRDFDGRDFMGERIIVQPSRESRRQRDDYYDRPPMSRGPPRRGVRLHVIGIPDRTSWQDLKDFGRQASQGIMYADVDRNDPSIGIIEFPSMAEAEDAISRLSGMDIRGQPVKLDFAPEGGAPGGGGGYAPRDYDRRPPPPSRDYDDRRGGYGGDDRRGGFGSGGYGGGDGGYPPRRDDYGSRDDYRRDDRPPRRDYDRDRSPPRRAERDRYDDRSDRAPPADAGRSGW